MTGRQQRSLNKRIDRSAHIVLNVLCETYFARPVNRGVTIPCALILAGLLLPGAYPALGQTVGHLKGRISDRSGGAIDKAHIIVESASGRFEAIANDNGEYDLELPAGTYNISTKKITGFVPYSRKRVKVKPGQATVLNVKLKVTLDDAICVLYISSAPIKKKKSSGKKNDKK